MRVAYYFAQVLEKTIGNHYLPFICYATVNEGQAIHIKNILTGAGAFPFMASVSLEPGDISIEVIESNIRSCDLFIPLLTEESTTNREWVQNEIGFAKALRKKIFPIVLGDEEKIKAKLGMISGVNYWMYEDNRLENTLKKNVYRYLWKNLIIIIFIIGFIIYRYLKNKGIPFH